MLPSRSIWENIQNLQAADTGTFANATAMNLHLASAAFVPSLDLAIGSLTEATFTGYAAIAGVSGTQPTYYDIATGLRVIELKPPSGGWHFACTGSTSLPQTIYGYYLTDHTNAILYGSALLPSPITLTASGQGFDLSPIKFAFSASSPS